jgi:hypothetical protein
MRTLPGVFSQKASAAKILRGKLPQSGVRHSMPAENPSCTEGRELPGAAFSSFRRLLGVRQEISTCPQGSHILFGKMSNAGLAGAQANLGPLVIGGRPAGKKREF